jgi:hypothetical protein
LELLEDRRDVLHISIRQGQLSGFLLGSGGYSQATHRFVQIVKFSYLLAYPFIVDIRVKVKDCLLKTELVKANQRIHWENIWTETLDRAVGLGPLDIDLVVVESVS